jgi:hypothetical protein
VHGYWRRRSCGSARFLRTLRITDFGIGVGRVGLNSAMEQSSIVGCLPGCCSRARMDVADASAQVILVRLHEDGAEIVELLDFGGGEGAIVDADVVESTRPGSAAVGDFSADEIAVGQANAARRRGRDFWPFT